MYTITEYQMTQLRNQYPNEYLLKEILSQKHNEYQIYKAIPGYVYKEDDGSMVETKLSCQFIADTNGQAVQEAIAFSKDRFKNIYKNYYKDSFLGSLKVYLEHIAPLNNGVITASKCMPIFEWKYDWPVSLELCLESFI